MQQILFDTNVVMDVLLERDPFVKAASVLLDANVRGEVNGVLGATTVTTLFYLLSRAQGADEARGHVQRLLQHFDVASVQRRVLERAAASDFADFEDAVLHEAARESGAEGIVTRYTDDFAPATLSIYTPHELVRALNESL